jgi:transcriptional regulator with XRE-family HTH domain
MSKHKVTETVNWSALRLAAGMTLAEAAEKSGYGIATINGLERNGAGSKRLMDALHDLYGCPPGVSEPKMKPQPVDWRSRALYAEDELRSVQKRLINLAENILTPPKK